MALSHWKLNFHRTEIRLKWTAIGRHYTANLSYIWTRLSIVRLRFARLQKRLQAFRGSYYSLAGLYACPSFWKREKRGREFCQPYTTGVKSYRRVMLAFTCSWVNWMAIENDNKFYRKFTTSRECFHLITCGCVRKFRSARTSRHFLLMLSKIATLTKLKSQIFMTANIKENSFVDQKYHTGRYAYNADQSARERGEPQLFFFLGNKTCGINVLIYACRPCLLHHAVA